jgi:hypothetical protein
VTSTKSDVNLWDAGKDLSSALGMLVRWWVFRWDWWLDCLALVLVYAVVATPVDGHQWRVVPGWPTASATLVVFLTLAVCLLVWRRRGPAQGWYGMWRTKRDKERERNTFAKVVRELELKGRDGLLGVGDPYPRLRDVRVTNGVTTGRVELPPGLKDGMVGFLKRRDDIAGCYPDDRRHGPIERLLMYPAPVNASRHANFVLIRRPLELPAPLTEVAPAAAQSYRLGSGFYGDVRWDLVDDPHAGIFGPTRTGKGNLVRYIAIQALRAGQHVDVIDGTGSREWEPLLAHQGLFRWRPYDGPSDDARFYTWACETVNLFGEDMALRNRTIGGAGHDNFTNAAKAGAIGGLRRRLLVVDEASSTLQYAGSSKPVKAAVDELAGLIDAAAKAAAKAGGHVVVMDQLPYQGATGIAQATRAQLGRWVVTGPVPDQMKPAVSGLQSWPFDTPEGRGFAATGRRGLSAELLVVPQVGRDAVRG